MISLSDAIGAIIRVLPQGYDAIAAAAADPKVKCWVRCPIAGDIISSWLFTHPNLSEASKARLLTDGGTFRRRSLITHLLQLHQIHPQGANRYINLLRLSFFAQMSVRQPIDLVADYYAKLPPRNPDVDLFTRDEDDWEYSPRDGFLLNFLDRLPLGQSCRIGLTREDIRVMTDPDWHVEGKLILGGYAEETISALSQRSSRNADLQLQTIRRLQGFGLISRFGNSLFHELNYQERELGLAGTFNLTDYPLHSKLPANWKIGSGHKVYIGSYSSYEDLVRLMPDGLTPETADWNYTFDSTLILLEHPHDWRLEKFIRDNDSAWGVLDDEDDLPPHTFRSVEALLPQMTAEERVEFMHEEIAHLYMINPHHFVRLLARYNIVLDLEDAAATDKPGESSPFLRYWVARVRDQDGPIPEKLAPDSYYHLRNV